MTLPPNSNTVVATATLKHSQLRCASNTAPNRAIQSSFWWVLQQWLSLCFRQSGGGQNGGGTDVFVNV
jgi:hypothetical protein